MLIQTCTVVAVLYFRCETFSVL